MSITKATVAAVIRKRQQDPSRFKTTVLRDAQVKGLSLAVHKQGETWRYQYKPRGTRPDGRRWPTRTLTIGDHQAFSITEAREAALIAKQAVASGRDPVGEQQADRAQRVAERKLCIDGLSGQTKCREMIPAFLENFAQRPSKSGGTVGADYVKSVGYSVGYVLDAMGAMDVPPASIPLRDIRVAFEHKRGAVWLLRFTALNAFLDYAVTRELVDLNLARQVKGPKRSAGRDRVLTPNELRYIWNAADKLAQTRRDLLRFLICVPCRSGEAFQMVWRDLSDDLSVWRQPGKMTKNSEPHEFAMHPLARKILQGRPRQSDYVFPFNAAGGPIVNRSHLITQFRKITPDIPHWTPHDMRRTFATLMAESGLGFADSVIDRVLNHAASATTSGVMGVYNRASRKGDQAEAMAAWGRILSDIVDRPTGNVVAIR
ncbi:site-specific integrase [Ruegeria sp. HKCCD7318]|uniref:tyrosine-type recombinase/integrase n=1 Tax=Ruegeria sp. HKCCD7318 TaxID=2683014 RepID=UPI00148098AB|nr:site-specific integrase [Ruegeria sp. HKCCD7318]NOE35242.1 tyrosine-type recombinase/integrase [Ruegeria sp. HKCCD7318]